MRLARLHQQARLSARPFLASSRYRAARGRATTSDRSDLDGMAATLDRARFTEELSLCALKVPSRQCAKFVKLLKGHLIDRPNFRPVHADSNDSSSRLVLLRERHAAGVSSLPAELAAAVEAEPAESIPYKVTLTYDNYTANQVLKAPTAFETVGHIAHLNLKADQLAYKHAIGQVLIDKNPSIRTVVNKLGTIENEFRVFSMEVLAGDPCLEAEVRQHRAKFKLNFRQVYWNSRLEQEHRRLTDCFQPGQRVIDVMAGIGPFAIPAAQRGCQVRANDLNPASHKYLEENVCLNKVAAAVRASCLDGRAFIRQMCRGWTLPGEAKGSSPKPPFHHAILNLPASATTFLDAFRGACPRDLWQEDNLPWIHCYAFAVSADDVAGCQERVEAVLGHPLANGLQVHDVRNVAPNKSMLCLTFQLPASAAFEEDCSGELQAYETAGEAQGNDAKRQRLEPEA